MFKEVSLYFLKLFKEKKSVNQTLKDEVSKFHIKENSEGEFLYEGLTRIKPFINSLDILKMNLFQKERIKKEALTKYLYPFKCFIILSPKNHIYLGNIACLLAFCS